MTTVQVRLRRSPARKRQIEVGKGGLYGIPVPKDGGTRSLRQPPAVLQRRWWGGIRVRSRSLKGMAPQSALIPTHLGLAFFKRGFVLERYPYRPSQPCEAVTLSPRFRVHDKRILYRTAQVFPLADVSTAHYLPGPRLRGNAPVQFHCPSRCCDG